MLTAVESQLAAAGATVSYEMWDGTVREFPLTTELLHDAGCSRVSWLIDDRDGRDSGMPIIVCTCDVAILLDQGGQL